MKNLKIYYDTNNKWISKPGLPTTSSMAVTDLHCECSIYALPHHPYFLHESPSWRGKKTKKNPKKPHIFELNINSKPRV